MTDQCHGWTQNPLRQKPQTKSNHCLLPQISTPNHRQFLTTLSLKYLKPFYFSTSTAIILLHAIIISGLQSYKRLPTYFHTAFPSNPFSSLY